MKVGDLVEAQVYPSMRAHIGVIIAITIDHHPQRDKYRYKVFFPNPPKPWWNEGTWNRCALELV
tara:strand:- start:7 stop:198 length:192 start_codon:yes stop_codon:yes gene_type:complete